MLFGKNKEVPNKDCSENVYNKVKGIQIFTKRLMKSSLLGDYLSAFKGSGLEFDQLREYLLGDDIRFIDWNCSAKMNKIMVKQLVEERDRTVILAIDLSSSSLFSSQEDLRKDMIAQVAASLAFVASENKDRVGVLFFTDKVEKWIAPANGRAHFGKIIESLYSIKPEKNETSIKEALRFLVGLKKRNAIIFMLSDFIDDVGNYSNFLKIVSCEYDFIGIRFIDECEKNLPSIGFLDICDIESGKKLTIDTNLKKNNSDLFLNKLLQDRLFEQRRTFEKYRIDFLDLIVGKSFVNSMINFFKQRIRRQI